MMSGERVQQLREAVTHRRKPSVAAFSSADILEECLDEIDRLRADREYDQRTITLASSKIAELEAEVARLRGALEAARNGFTTTDPLYRRIEDALRGSGKGGGELAREAIT